MSDERRFVPMFSIRDVKAGLYESPWPSINRGTAIRQFFDRVTAQGSRLGTHREDYALFEVGSFCEEDCTMVSSDRVRLIGAHELSAQ